MKGTKNKILALGIILSMMFAMVAMSASAEIVQSGTCGENLTWTLDNGILTISGTGDMANYSYDTFPWYSSIESINSVIIKNGVTSISNYAFNRCESLTSVTTPDSVTSIGMHAFGGCSSLTSVTIPNSVTSIDFGAFEDCKSLVSITIPDSVTYIGRNAFGGCSSLTSIIIPDSVTSIGAIDFSDTLYYNEDSNWENDLLYLGNLFIAAKDTVSGSVAIRNGTKAIAFGAFADCIDLTSIIIPDSVICIGDEAFRNCSNLNSITIPDSVTSIGACAFENCTGFTSVTIPNSVKSIGYDAFMGCNNLNSITIPDSVTSIGVYAFLDTAYWNDDNNWENGILYIGNHLISASGTNVEIKNGTKTIADRAFWDSDELISVIIPNSVTNICDLAFFECGSLTSITIGNGVTDLSIDAIKSCYNLTSVTVSDENNYFSSLDGVLFDKNKTELILYPSNKTGSYTVPDSVTSIGHNAFESCWELISVEIPNSVTSIGDGAFYDCGSLTSVTIPDSVTSIGEFAFADCTSLTSVAIPNSVTSIDNVVFQGCHTLTSVTIPGSITNIGYNAFNGCTSLENITIPDSVTSIGWWAFSGCTSLTNVYYTGSEAEWNTISINTGNENLTNANIHFNCTGGTITGTADQIVLAIGNINASVWGNASANDVAPVIRNDRTMLPIRFVAEALGASVGWNDASRAVTITADGTIIEIVIDSSSALLNGAEMPLDCPAFIENGRTFLPLRFVSEALGAHVQWIPDGKQIIITR